MLCCTTFLVAIAFHGSMCMDGPIVKIQQGKIQGVILESFRSQRHLFAFMGIPYAKPAVGNLRFKAPEPAESWTGVRDAQNEGDVCMQINFLKPVLVGSEDCLFINVYTPQLPDLRRNISQMPVMVWIHGGAFTFGSGNRADQSPDYLIDKEVVVVTFNYRLSVLGFLSLENKDVPGNAGLKDQVMALRWVQQNIAQFGGDPGSVTIFGQSAGAASVHYHLLSPMSEGIFHKAISESGSALCPWAFTKSARKVAYRLGALLGMNTTDDLQLLDFLRGVPPEELVQMSNGNLLTEEERDPFGFSLPFVPTKEDVYEDGEEVFLPGDPKELIQEGKFEPVPFLTGACSHEGYMIYYVSELSQIELEDLDNDSKMLVLPSFDTKSDSLKTMEIGEKIKKFYFQRRNISNETLQDLIKMTTDFYFKYPVYSTVKLQSAMSTCPVYFYQFAFEGRYGYKKAALGFGDMPGAIHGEELGYLFVVDALRNLNLSIESQEVRLSSKLVKMWTDFAKTGNPTPDTQLNMEWLPYTMEQHNCLLIDNELSLTLGTDEDRMTFCEELYNTMN